MANKTTKEIKMPINKSTSKPQLKSSIDFRKNAAKTMIAQAVISLIGFPFASNITYAQQSTTPQSTTPNCSGYATGTSTDLYCATLGAIQAYGYQPASSTTGQSINGYWTLGSFQGGNMVSSPMVITAPAGQGTPVATILASTFIYNCPGNTKAATGSVTVSQTVSNSTDISSTTSVTNSSSSYNGGSATIAIGYTSPVETGGGNGSASASYDWGSTSETDTTTGGGTDNASGTSSTYTYESNYSVLPGYGQYVSIVDNVTQYAGANWTSTMSLTGNLTGTIFGQVFKSTQAPQSTTTSINGSGVPANIWYPTTTWTSTAGDVLASPAGTYAFIPNWTADLVGFNWAGVNSANSTYYQGGWYGTTNQGMNLLLDGGACTGGCAGNFWATNTAGNTVAWDSNTSPAYLAMQDDGNLVGYNSSNTVIWASNTANGITTPPQSYYPATPSQLLANSTAFTATGTYSATTYEAQAAMGPGTATLLTSDQITQYCANPDSSGQAPVTSQINLEDESIAMLEKSSVYTDGVDLFSAGSVLMNALYDPSAQGKFILVSDPVNPKDARILERKDSVRDGQSDPLNRGTDSRSNQNNRGNNKTLITPNSNKKGLGKVVHINGPIELRKDQYYAANLPGLKVTKVVITSDNLTNYVGFSSEKPPKGLEIDHGKVKKIHLRVGKRKHFFVQPK